jgi:peptide/nickel transport system substrate-binding protein
MAIEDMPQEAQVKEFLSALSIRDFDRRTLIRGGALLAAFGAGSALLSACAGTSSSSGPSTGGSTAPTGSGSGSIAALTFGMAAAVQDLNILRAFNIPSPTVLSLALEGLMGFTNELKLVPLLATSATNPEPTKWVYQVRPNVKFHDGTTLTAEDVAFSMNWHITKANGSEFTLFYTYVKHIAATGPLEVTVTLTQPDGLWPYTPAHTAGLVQSKAYLQSAGKNAGTPNHLPVGTGPFKITAFDPSQSINLERNENYWGTKPPLEKLTLQTIADSSTRLLAMRNGSIDGTYDVDFSQLSRWKSLSNAKLTSGAGLNLFYCSFNVTNPPFDDIHVRKAIAHSFNTPGLIKSQLGGSGQVATGFVPPLFWAPLGASVSEVEGWYSQNPQYPFDMAAAKSELAQSKVPNGFTTTVPYPSDYPRMGAALQDLQQNMKPLGVNIILKEMTEDQWLTLLYGPKPKLGMNVVVYYPDYPDPADYSGFVDTTQIANGWNLSSYSNPKLDHLMNTQLESSDSATRINAFKGVMKIIAEDVPVFPIWIENNVSSVDSNLNLPLSPIFYLQPWAAQITNA